MEALSNLLILILASNWCQDLDNKLPCRDLVIMCAQKYEKNMDKLVTCINQKENISGNN